MHIVATKTIMWEKVSNHQKGHEIKEVKKYANIRDRKEQKKKRWIYLYSCIIFYFKQKLVIYYFFIIWYMKQNKNWFINNKKLLLSLKFYMGNDSGFAINWKRYVSLWIPKNIQKDVYNTLYFKKLTNFFLSIQKSQAKVLKLILKLIHVFMKLNNNII